MDNKTGPLEGSKISFEGADRSSITQGETRVILENAALPLSLRGLSADELKACEKKLVRKIDARLMPMMILIYIMNYLDRYLLPTLFLRAKPLKH